MIEQFINVHASHQLFEVKGTYPLMKITFLSHRRVQVQREACQITASLSITTLPSIADLARSSPFPPTIDLHYLHLLV